MISEILVGYYSICYFKSRPTGQTLMMFNMTFSPWRPITFAHLTFYIQLQQHGRYTPAIIITTANLAIRDSINNVIRTVWNSYEN
jgi:hypothetical protein